MSTSRLSSPACRTFPVLLVAVAACFASLVLPRVARADRYYVVYAPGPPPPPPPAYGYYYYREPAYALMIAADLEGAVPINPPHFVDGNDLTGGGGFKFRIGEQIRLRGGLRLTPEVGYGYDHLFATDDVGNSYDWDMHRLFTGVRLGFGRVVVPVIYGHIGYGWRVTGDPSVPQEDGFAFDFGGALDIRVIPHFGFGAHIEYARIAEQFDSPEWVAMGVHADVLF